MKPTPRANDLADLIKVMLSDIEALVTPAGYDPFSSTMTILISANDYMQHSLIVPLIKILQKEAPQIRLAILPADIVELRDKMARGTIDLAVTIPEFSSPDLPRRLLYTDRYICAARKGHQLKEKNYPSKTFADLTTSLFRRQVAALKAGSTDPALLFEQNKAEDPKREGWANFLATWFDAFSSEPTLLRDALGSINSFTDDDGDLQEAIRDLLPNGNVTSGALGVVIRKFAGQWINGFRIIAPDAWKKSRKSKKWCVKRQQN